VKEVLEKSSASGDARFESVGRLSGREVQLMKRLPATENTLVLRTDYTDLAAWKRIRVAIREPVGEDEYQAYVDFVSDPQYQGVTAEQLVELLPRSWNHTFAFIVDRLTLTHPERPILVVNTHRRPVWSFRVIPSEMCSVENNLSTGNMGFEEFANSVDSDGIYRGFPKP
jgi:hypothetical protein